MPGPKKAAGKPLKDKKGCTTPGPGAIVAITESATQPIEPVLGRFTYYD